MSLVLAPEDLPHFDPEDDRAEYLTACESVAEVDYSAAVRAGYWPETAADA